MSLSGDGDVVFVGWGMKARGVARGVRKWTW